MKRRLLSLLIAGCMVAGMVSLPVSPVAKAATVIGDYGEDYSTRVYLKATTTTEVLAVLWDYKTAPVGKPSSAVQLIADPEWGGLPPGYMMFAGTLNEPDKAAVYDMYVSTNGGSSWSKASNYDSRIIVPGVGMEHNRFGGTLVGDAIVVPNKIRIRPTSLLIGEVKGVVRSLTQSAPKIGEMPDDAFTYEKETIPGYESDIYYTGAFTVPLGTGEYIIYSTINSGATWDTNWATYIRVQNGVIVACHWGDRSSGWDEWEFAAFAELDGTTLKTYGYSGLPSFPAAGKYQMSLVDDYTGKTIQIVDCETKPEYNGRKYYADLTLPETEGFYKVYYLAQGMEILADKAFWVDDAGNVTVVELKGINSPQSKPVLIFPIGTPEEDMIPDEWGTYSLNVPYINLTNEKCELGSLWGTDLSYSFDGGKTWKSQKLDWHFFHKALDSKTGVELWLADKKLDKGAKQPPADATIYKFPKIAPRPVTPKLSINYQALYLSSDRTPYLDRLTQQTFWVLSKATDDTIVYDGIEITPEHPDYKKETDFYSWIQWYEMPQTGVAVQPLSVTTRETRGKTTYNAKVQKTMYYLRTKPVENADGTYTPASKLQKLSAEGLQKPAAVKPNYTKENIKPPKDTAYRLGNKSGVGDGRKLVDLADDAGSDFTYRKLPTRKKPASVAVTLSTPEKTRFDPKETKVDKGKVVADSELQFNYGDGKWVRFKAPRGPQSGEILVRAKPKPKSSLSLEYSEALATDATMSESDNTKDIKVASEVFSFTYDWGEYEGTNGRTATGVTDFEFEPVDEE